MEDPGKIFKPLTVLDYSDKQLVLEESSGRRIFLFTYFRIWPVLMAAALFAIALAFDFPWLQRSLLIAMGFMFLVILWKGRYISKISIGREGFEVTLHFIRGKQVMHTPRSAVDAITVETYYFNTAGGYFYRLSMKDGSKARPLLTIPYLYMRQDRKQAITNILEEITGLKVRRY